MKRLISSEDIEKAKSLGEEIYIDDNTIVTAQAYDTAKKYGINIVNECDRVEKDRECCKDTCDVTCDKACEQTCEVNKHEQALSEEDIYRLLSYALEAGVISESDLSKLI